MSKIAIVGDITTKPGSFDEYFELMKIHAAAESPHHAGRRATIRRRREVAGGAMR